MNKINKENIDKIAAFSLQAQMTCDDLKKFITNTNTKLVGVSFTEIKEYRKTIRITTASKALGF